MTVRVVDAGTIALEGVCPIEDAELLLQHLLATPDAVVDWRACEQAHAAIIQALIISAVILRGPPKGEFLQNHVLPMIERCVGQQTF